MIEEAWSKGEQTIDISAHFPGWPYIMNFCNLTQVKSTTGVVRPIRRTAQQAYPAVRLTQAEVAAMIHRKEARRMELALAAEKRKLAAMAKKTWVDFCFLTLICLEAEFEAVCFPQQEEQQGPGQDAGDDH